MEFSTVCWFETHYSVYTMRQASRHSWRIGQTQPVQVVFMAYRNTLQADALKLVAQKLQASLAAEGAGGHDCPRRQRGDAAEGAQAGQGNRVTHARSPSPVTGSRKTSPRYFVK